MRKYLLGVRKEIAIQVAFSFLYALTIACYPYLRKLLFDNVYALGIGYAFLLIGIHFAVSIASAIVQNISQKYEWKTEQQFNLKVKADIFKKTTRLSYRNYQRLTIAEYSSLVNNDVKAIVQDYIEPLVDIIKSSGHLVIYSVFMIVFVDWRITAAIIASSLIAVFAPKLTANKLSRLSKERQEQIGKYLTVFQDLLGGFKLISLVTRHQIERRYSEQLAINEDAQFAYGKYRTFSNVLNGFIMDFIGVTAFISVALLLIRGKITVGTGVATFGYIESFVYPIKYIINDISALNSSREIIQKIIGFLSQPSAVKPVKTDVNAIEFENVSVSLGDFKLRSFSHRFEKGKKYAVIGSSGSGKSTLLNLIMGYAESDEGRILIDGEPLGESDNSAIIQHVSQTEHIFADSFANNCTVYDSFAGSDLVNKLNGLINAVKVSVLTTLQARKEKCDTLSGGEKQVIGIVRSVVNDTPVLLLDEPVSALDPVNANRCIEAILGDNERLVIMITHDHDKELLTKFDEIIVMSAGNVSASGSYDDIAEVVEIVTSSLIQFKVSSGVEEKGCATSGGVNFADVADKIRNK
jgi:ABC-type multidrug transport system fused ATPase/permease subunit